MPKSFYISGPFVYFLFVDEVLRTETRGLLIVVQSIAWKTGGNGVLKRVLGRDCEARDTRGEGKARVSRFALVARTSHLRPKTRLNTPIAPVVQALQLTTKLVKRNEIPKRTV